MDTEAWAEAGDHLRKARKEGTIADQRATLLYDEAYDAAYYAAKDILEESARRGPAGLAAVVDIATRENEDDFVCDVAFAVAEEHGWGRHDA